MRSMNYACLSALAATMPVAAADLDAKFLIEREGKVIGHHAVDVTETEEGVIVETDIEMRVKFGPIPLFRYNHEAREVWRDGALVALTSRTNNNGDRSRVEARRENGALMIDGTDYKGAAPAGAVPSSYWAKSLVDAEALINTQTGEIIDITVEALGETLAPHAAPAEQYRVTGSVALNIWYEGDQWVGSNFVIDGEELTYVLAPDNERYAALSE